MRPAVLPKVDPAQLFGRLARLRRRLRIVDGLRGISAVLAVVLGGVLIAGLLDYVFPLPALVRALALVGIIAWAGRTVYRRLVIPFSAPTDNLHLALRIEERNPELNDLLASAVQFLDQPPEDETSSPLLRSVAIRRAARTADEYNFNDLISFNGLFWTGVLLGLILAVIAPLAVFAPAPTRTAVMRLLTPFGGNTWPARTTIRILAPDRFPYKHPLGDALEIRAEISKDDALPERAIISIWHEGSPSYDQTHVIVRDESAETRGSLVARLEPSRASRSFKFRIAAGDVVTDWNEIEVLPPPELAPLDGRPSPQVALTFPRYTDLPPRSLPNGASKWDAVAGTSVHLRAATNRPVARAWIAYRPEYPVLNTSAALLPLASFNVVEGLFASAAGRSVWERVPVTLSGNGTVLDVTFTPRIAGPYALRFEDESGFGATRLIDIQVTPDPAPVVTLDRPSASRDSLTVTPTAVLPLKSSVLDSMFAVRSAWLEYRTHRDDSPRQQMLFDHAAVGRSLPSLMGLAGPPPLNAPAVKLRLPEVLVNDRLRVASFRHPDGSGLKEGDLLIIQMAADDFDDVSGLKEPGRSHEVELRIVSPATLEAILNNDQAQVRQNLLRMQQWQREAREKAADAQVQKETTGKLRPEDLEKLMQAEQLQQQLRARVGDDKEGLRAEVERIRQARADNQLPPSASQDRMDAVANELERLAREELTPIEQLLHSAREQADAKPDADPAQPKHMKPTGAENRREPLAQALKHQREVEETLSQLLERLEPWSGANEARGETRAALNEQQKLQQQTDELDKQIPAGAERQRLQEQQRADLDRAAARQEALANQMKQLLEKMDRLGAEKDAQQRERLQEADKLDSQAQDRERLAEQSKGTDKENEHRAEAQRLREQAQEQRQNAQQLGKESQALKEAAKTGRQELGQENAGAPQTKMHEAAQDLKENNLSKARQKQQESAKAMNKMLDRLEERRADDLDRLAKKVKDLERRIDDLADQQARLQKKSQQAQQIANPEEREKELERLAREQEKLQDEAKDLVQELSRMKNREAAQAMNRAARAMEQAQQRMERGENPTEPQEEALDRLDQAQQQAEQQRQLAEEELQREKMEKYTERIKAIRDRQEASTDEVKRIHEKALKARKWEDGLLRSLNDQIDVEAGLAGELVRHAEAEFKPVKVAAKMLEMAADSMKTAAAKIEARREDIKNRPADEPWDPALEQRLHEDAARWQRAALRRLDQFLEALKPDKDTKQQANAGGGGGGGGGGGAQSRGDDVPLLAQLKALRSLQAELNERTEQFAKDHPDVSKLTEADKLEIDTLQKMQRDVAQLLAEFNNAAAEAKEAKEAKDPKGEKP